MSIKVGIVENDKKQADYLKEQLSEWHRQFSIKEDLLCDVFCRGDRLLEHLDRDYEIVFIDIELHQKENGIMLAKKLREFQFQKEIVFLTSHTEYVFEGYGVRALDFLIKPVTVLRIGKCMESVLRRKNGRYYTFKDKQDGNVKKVAYSDILYFLSAKHCVEIVTRDRVYKEMRSFQNLSGSLPTDFVQCHRTVVVNIRLVQELKREKEVVMENGQQLPVSRTYWKEVKSCFMRQCEESF